MKFMRAKMAASIIIFFGVLLFHLGIAFCASESGRITASELKTMIDKGEKVTLIDVRTHKEYNGGYIPGAINIPLDKIPEMKDFPYQGKIVVYCRSGVRSLKTKKMFDEKGYKGILDLEGGINAWIKNGGKTVKPQKPSTQKQPDNSQQNSLYPKEFIIPKGVCEQGIEPALVFTTPSK